MYRKAGRLLRVILMLVLIVFVLPGKTVQARSFEIKQLNILWDIQKNGDINVTESYTYKFSGDFNGVTKNIDVSGTDGLENLAVHIEEFGMDREVFRSRDYNPQKAYTLETDGTIEKIKVYEKSSGGEKIFKYTYTLKNALTRYADTADLNRVMVVKGNMVDINIVNAEIKIPEGAKKEDIKIFVHGDLTGKSDIVDNRTISLRVADVTPEEEVEVRLLFPPEIIADSENTSSDSILGSVLAQEQKFADKANRTRDEAIEILRKKDQDLEKEMRLKAEGERLNPVFIGAAGAGIVAMILAAVKFGKSTKPRFQGEYFRELPGDYPPAITAYLMYNKNIASKDILATLLNLAEKKVISIEPYKSIKRGFLGREKEETDYLLKDLKGDISGLSEHERYLYDWFLHQLGQGGELRMDDLEDMMKKKKTGLSFAQKFDIFKDKVRGEGSLQKFWTSASMKGALPFVIGGILLIVGGAAAIVFYGMTYGNIISVISGIMLLALLIILAVTPRLTEYGADQTAKWNAFRKFLLHFSSMDKNEIPSLTVWNHYLVYATALGVAKEVIDQLPEVFSAEEMETLSSRGGYYPMFYSGGGFYRMDRAINSSVSDSMSFVRAQQIASSARSSGSGSGGGFSSGSSGGSGGGGGGAGAF